MQSSTVQIVPSLPPEVGGVGDYALTLSRHWATNGKHCSFIALRGGEDLSFPVRHVAWPRASSLLACLEGVSATVLHHSPYGYARYGLCVWMATALPAWRAADTTRRLVVIMHEVAADGPPWSTAFWAGVVQRWIARRLASAADFVITSSEGTRQQIANWGDASPISVPVFSNVGETAHPLLASQRPPHAVVFGGPWQRERLYRALVIDELAVAAAFATAGIHTIFDIGPPFTGRPDSIAGVNVQSCGVLSSEEVRQILASCRFGLVHYPHHVLTKSGIVAAYLANGMICVNLSRAGTEAADIIEGREFVTIERFAIGDYNGDAVATAGHVWYSGHSASVVSELLDSALSSGNNSE